MEQQYEVIALQTDDGKIPFQDWVRSIKDQKAQQLILARIERIKFGNFGDWKHLQDGLNELRIMYGPGYRIYFGRKENRIVILLGGGTKRTQRRDIKKLLQLWREYEDREV